MGNSRQSEDNFSHPKEEMKAKVAYSRMLWMCKGKNVHNEGKNNREHHAEYRSSMFLEEVQAPWECLNGCLLW